MTRVGLLLKLFSMNLYEIKWYVNGVLTETKCEAYWCDSDLTDRWDWYTTEDGMLRYEYVFIKEIKLPNLI